MLHKLFSILEKFTKKEENLDNSLENILSKLSSIGISLTTNQNKILSFLFHSTSKVKVVEAPTGSGKTLSFLIYAFSKNSDYDKIIISTYTKGLQNQVLTEIKKYFPEYIDQTLILLGKSNYTCLDKVDYLSQMFPAFSLQTDNKLAKQTKVSSYYCNEKYRANCQFKEKCLYYQTISSIEDKKILIINHSLLPYIIKNIHEKKILLIVDECHTLYAQREVVFTNEDFQSIEEPKATNFSNIREYNLALEKYKIQAQKQKLAEILQIKSPGKYYIEQKDIIEFTIPAEILMFSGTLPEKFGIPDEDLDILYLSDVRSWQNVTITVKDINYNHPEYYRVLLETIKEARKKYNKVIVLCTSYQQLKFLKSKFGQELHTNLEEKPFILAEKMKAREINLIAGTDTFWTGIDIPGEKCIIMTKLPFPVPEGNEKNEESFITGFQLMFRKFKQGIGRMLRTSKCGGEILILDNRITKYNDLMAYLEELKKKNAKIIFEYEPNIDKQKIIKVDFSKKEKVVGS